jgi:cysteine desulfurase
VRVPDALPADTAVVSLMAANHETGVVQPVAAARVAADAAGAWLHVDATHAAGRVALPTSADGLVLSAHKLGGPVGIGALVLRDGGPFPALLPGVQERGRRGGTVNVAGAVGFGAAVALARARLAGRTARATALTARLEAALVALGGGVVGAGAPRVPGTTCVVFPGVRGDAVVQALDLRGVAVSSGAACASGSTGASPVLRALGHPEPAGGVRITLGPDTDDGAIDAVVAVLPGVLEAIRLADTP